MTRLRALALALPLAMLGPAMAAAAPFEPRSDTYEVEWGGMTLGRATITLAPLERNCWRYDSVTRPIALVRWTYGSPQETSEFCLEGNRIRPRRFEYRNDRREKDHYTLDFDWTQRTVKAIKGGEVSVRELPGPAYDRFVLQ
jgi:hypothetical protein